MHEEMFYTVIYTLICTSLKTMYYKIGPLIQRTHWFSGFTGAISGGDQCNATRHIVVCEVLPQQQCLLVLLPRQTVAVIVDVKRLTPSNRGVI